MYFSALKQLFRLSLSASHQNPVLESSRISPKNVLTIVYSSSVGHPLASAELCIGHCLLKQSRLISPALLDAEILISPLFVYCKKLKLTNIVCCRNFYLTDFVESDHCLFGAGILIRFLFVCCRNFILTIVCLFVAGILSDRLC